MPLVYLLPPAFASVMMPWRNLPITEEADVETLWRAREICFVNPRGCGLSDRDATDFNLERLTDDLEAVVDRTGWAQFSLFGMGMSGPVAILYASRHPEFISRLILKDTYLRAADMGKIARIRALGAVLGADFDSYLDLMVLLNVGWNEPQVANELRDFLSETSSQEAVQALANATASYNVTGLAELISVPTLFLNPS